MKTRTKFILLISILSLLLVAGSVVYKLITEPLNMRFSTGSIDPWRFVSNSKKCWSVNRTGLKEANFSGSGALILDYLKDLNDKMGPNLLVINGIPGNVWHLNGRHLRHLCYKYDGKTLTHYNRKKDMVCDLRRLIVGVPLKPEDVDTSLIYTEFDKMDELGISYINPLTDSWTYEWDYVETLLSIFDTLDPQVTHLHFHCEHGKGRTTTLMVLYDIYRNFNQISLQSIIDRNFCLGGEDMMNTVIWKRGTWSQENLENRRRLIQAFYDYMTNPSGYGKIPWTEWLKIKEAEGYAHLPQIEKQKSPHEETA